MNLIPVINKSYLHEHYLYIMYAPKVILRGPQKGQFTDAVKIGITGTPWERLRQYNKLFDTYVFDFLYVGEENDIKRLEKDVLDYYRLHKGLMHHSFANTFSKEVIAEEIDSVHELMVSIAENYGYNISLRAINYNVSQKSKCPFGHDSQKKANSQARFQQSSQFNSVFEEII
jgi:hypothetical protein